MMHIERKHLSRIGMLLLILTVTLLAGCAGAEDESATTGEINERATELAEDDTVEERATTAIEEGVDEVQRDDTADADVTAGATGTAGAETQPDTNTVRVELTEYEIRMPATLPAGVTQFQVSNVGTGEHSFAIEGDETEIAFDDHLQVGETKRLEVELPAGTYTVYCPVAEHRERGMQLQVEVTASE